MDFLPYKTRQPYLQYYQVLRHPASTHLNNNYPEAAFQGGYWDKHGQRFDHLTVR